MPEALGGPLDCTNILRMRNTGFGHHAWICLLMDLVRWLSPSISVQLNHLMIKLLSSRMNSHNGRAAMFQSYLFTHSKNPGVQPLLTT